MVHCFKINCYLPAVLQYTLNQDIQVLSDWFIANFLQLNRPKTQAMILGKSSYNYDLKIENSAIKIKDNLKILGVTLDSSLTFKPHITEMLKKTYGKIAALHRLKCTVPMDILIKLYNAYELPHLEYCSPILIGINKSLRNKLEHANYYGLRTLMNLRNNVSYESVLNLTSMHSLEHKRLEQSLIIFFRSFKQQGPIYISNFFKTRVMPYTLRGSGHNVAQESYNTSYLHNSYTHTISRIWNQLPTLTKSSTTLS